MSEHESQTTIADAFVASLIAEAASDPAKVPKLASLLSDLLADQRELRAIKAQPTGLRKAAEEAVRLMNNLEDDLREYKDGDAVVFQHAATYIHRLRTVAASLAAELEKGNL